jgi:hypothetical protein
LQNRGNDYLICTENPTGADVDQGPRDDERTTFAFELLKDQLSSINRSSELSFQCSGEPKPLFSDEAAWLRSPLSYPRRRRPLRMVLRTPRSPADEQDSESWFSDTSSDEDYDDLSVSLLYQ